LWEDPRSGRPSVVGFVLFSFFLLGVGWFCLGSSLGLLVGFSYGEEEEMTTTTMMLVLCLFCVCFVLFCFFFLKMVIASAIVCYV
jgi:hypothetical protein